MGSLKLATAALFSCCAVAAGASTIPLGGTWSFRLDPGNVGHAQHWYQSDFDPRQFIFLPGSTDQGGYGAKIVEPEKGWLNRPYRYVGPAWYQKRVVIPDSWRNDHIELFLERAHWQTEVWIDGHPAGMQNSLSTPDIFDLSDLLPPGAHTITICVDNTLKIDVGGRASSVTDNSQTNWNGIIGQIALHALPPVWIGDVRIQPDFASQTLTATVAIRNRTGQPGSLELDAAIAGLSTHRSERLPLGAADTAVRIALPMSGLKFWDEYEPALYTLRLDLFSHPSGRTFEDHAARVFGIRQIGTRGTQFLLNGRPVFLRGTLECAIFPLTGYPPTTVASWQRLFQIARSYGLNAFRFHSYCPPEAAFIAADREGFLLHVELPVWSHNVGKARALDDFMRAEGYRILNAYGNHPSFTMMCLGNELLGDFHFMDDLVAEFKRSDPRRLYTFSADFRRRVPGPSSDYYDTQETPGGRLRISGTRFAASEGGNDYDYSASVRAIHVPLVAHELGQWAVYPSYDEIPKYTGVLKARNLEICLHELESRGMIDERVAFQHASGSFAWSVYKEDIEATLRTPGFGGFFLLELEDFPGQGEALVGLLDSLWDSKGILTPAEFRRFCSETVPLLRMKKFVWLNNETFTGAAEVANYSKNPIRRANAVWTAQDDSGRVVFSGKFRRTTVPLGSVTSLGLVSFPLRGFARATHLKISVRMEGTSAANDWDIWVYPAAVHLQPPAGLLVTSSLDQAARSALEQGRTVVLLLPPHIRNDHLQPARFLPVFWSNAWFGRQPGTMGILCHPAHPALAQFPTFAGSSWQWWELTQNSRAFILDDTPPSFRPIIQEIDDFHRNHKLGRVLEARVGNGRLLAVSFDLVTNLENRPVARQMLYSLLQYAAGPNFRPQDELPVDYILKLVSPADH
jgi:hypothetical protein